MAKPTYEQLYKLYQHVANLTVNHDALSPVDFEGDDDQYAVVFPNQLDTVLKQVDPDWVNNWTKSVNKL